MAIAAGSMIMFLLEAAVCRAAEPTFRLSTDRQQYLRGEPVILKMVIDFSQLTSDQIKTLRPRSGETCVVTRSDGRRFPPVPACTNRDHRYRTRVGSQFQEYIFLQRLEFPLALERTPLPDWAADYLAAGSYSVIVEQPLGGSPTSPTLRSNAVEFAVIEPIGAAASALAELTVTPALLSIAGEESFRFSALATPDVRGQAVAFLQRHGDTAYGQIVLARCAFEAFERGNFELLAALYPALARAVDARRGSDFITQHLRFCYLVEENLLEEDFNSQSGLVTMQEFDRTLTDSPPWLCSAVRRLIKEHQDMIARNQPPPRERIAPLQKPLTDRGELPTPLEARARRHAIALGRQP